MVSRSPAQSGRDETRLDDVALYSRLDDRQPTFFERLSVALGAFWDVMSPSVGEGVADIRKKLVEEAMWGREVSPRELWGHDAPPPEKHGITDAHVVAMHMAADSIVKATNSFQELMAAQAAMLKGSDGPSEPQSPSPDR